MTLRLSLSQLRRIESLAALVAGAFLAALAGWAQVRYNSFQERIAAWNLVAEEVRVNQVLLEGHRTLGQVQPRDVSPNAEHRYNIIIPTKVLTRGYDLITEKALEDLSPPDLVDLAAYYMDLRTLNERIQMLQNFLVYGTVNESDQKLMPVLLRHYNSVATAAFAPLERSDRVAPMVDDIVRHLDARRRRLRHGFLACALLAGAAFVGVLGLGAAGLVKDDLAEKAA